MNARFACLLAAVALATGGSALAQDFRDGPPPLPPGPELRDGPPPMPAMPGVRRFELDREPGDRGPGPDACRDRDRGPGPRHDDPDRMRDRHGPRCEQVIRRFQGRLAGPSMNAMPMGPGPMPMGPGMAPMAPAPMPYAYVQPEYVTPGYMVPPLMWVRVPIIHEQQGCGCKEVVEERVITTTTVEHRPARRHRAVRGKYEKYAR